MNWWIVTLRQAFDDEDSLYIVQAKNADGATVEAAEAFRLESELAPDEEENLIFNYVVKCGRKKPELVQSISF